MNRQQAAALIFYLQRCHAIIPTTGAEWDLMRGVLPVIEGVANGILECTIEPVAPPSASEKPATAPAV